MMAIGYRVRNEWTGYKSVFYCGGCLDTCTGVEDMEQADGIKTCLYCGTLVADQDAKRSITHPEVRMDDLADWEIQLLSGPADAGSN